MSKTNKILTTVLIIILFVNFLNPIIYAEDVTFANMKVASGREHSIGLNVYGRVVSAGRFENGQCDTYSWGNIVDIAAGDGFSAGLKADGTVVTTQLISNSSRTFDFQLDVSGWSNIVAISAGGNVLAGINNEGKVLLAGKTDGLDAVLSWTGIKSIGVGGKFVLAVKNDGTGLSAGVGNASQTVIPVGKEIDKVFASPGMAVWLFLDKTAKAYGDQISEITINENSKTWLGTTWTDIEKIKLGYNRVIAKLGNGTFVTDETSSVDKYNVSNLNNIVEFSTETYEYGHSFYILENGTVIERGTPDARISSANWKLLKKPIDMVCKNYPLIAAAYNNVVAVRSDGVVLAANDVGTGNWENISYITAASGSAPFASIINSTVVTTTINDSIKNSINSGNMWSGIIKVSVGSSHAVALRWDGTVLDTKESKLNGKVGVIDIAAGNSFSAALFEDGKVLVEGTFADVDKSTCSSWSNIKKIYAGGSHLIGMKNDGSLVATGNNSFGQCNIQTWTDIIDVSVGHQHTVGLHSDGTVIAVGNTGSGRCNVSDWKNVKEIYAGGLFTLGYTNNGVILYSGSTTLKAKLSENWNLEGKQECEITSVAVSGETISVKVRMGGGESGLSGKVYFALADDKGNIIKTILSKEEIQKYTYLNKEVTFNNLSKTPTKLKVYYWDELLRPIYSSEYTL